MPEAPTIIHASIALPSSAATVNGIPSLKTLLDAADLLSFEHPLTCVLHLRHAGDIEYVDENDLLGIGMSRPEQKRLRKEYARLFPKSSVFGKLKKAFSREENRRAEERSGADQHQHVIPLDKITLAKELGRGEFGTVHMAYWNEGGGATTGERGGKEGELKVAVKCISSEKLLNNPTSFLSEAAIMHRMHHDDVVRLYGVVLDTKQIMMVSELASSGSLHSCLLNPSLRDSFPVQVLCAFAIQIARGMAYLEAQRLIHRDLAARNVLVFSATKVKISDFGLSRSLGVGEDYYRGEFSPTLRLPIAWCAPECINFLKFTHSSDVWAYGVTLWEMFAYGRMPWEGKNGAEILEAIDKQRRHLARPRLCPEDMYALMGECWAHDAGARPTFAALLAQLPDRLPLHVRAVVTMSSAPSADHLVYNRDDLIYVIDKNPEECPDGSYWLGSLKNGRTGLFLPKDTVAHLGAEPPATNRGETEEKKKEEKEKKEKKSKKNKGRRGGSHSDEEEVFSGSDGEAARETDSEASDNDAAYSAATRVIHSKMVEFFNTANKESLLSAPRIVERIAEKIMASRPFDGYEALRACISSIPRVSGNAVLDAFQEYLENRGVLEQILDDCRVHSSQVEEPSERAEEGRHVELPLLNPGMTLHGYQQEGVDWLVEMHHKGLNCILADEMGLGKTIQIVAFLSWLKHTHVRGPHLIVVPSSTVENWIAEMKTWCPTLKVITYYGSQEERRDIRHSAKKKKDTVDVLLTTYNMIGSKSDDKKFFKTFSINYVIFDEGHMLKNCGTDRYKSLMKIKTQRKILLTGTPLQNNLIELISLMYFTITKVFNKYCDDVTQLLQHFKQQRPALEGSDGLLYQRDRIEQAKAILQPYILRRVKSQVLSQLPPKSEEVCEVEMEEEQVELYEDVVEGLTKLDTGDTSNGYGGLMRLRQAANHPLLRRKLYEDATVLKIAKMLCAKEKQYAKKKPEHLAEELEGYSDFQLHQLCEKFHCTHKFLLEESLALKSGKLKFLDGKLAEIKQKGDKVLIFSQFTSMLDILEVYLRLRGYTFSRLDGTTPVLDRLEMINAYNEDPGQFVFLLSTRAGGLGINLVSANHIILHDIDFNPYNDKQAEDRCHRMGQKKPVYVTRLISKETIEVEINKLARKKLQLEKDVTEGSRGLKGEEGGDEREETTPPVSGDDLQRMLTEAIQRSPRRKSCSERNGMNGVESSPHKKSPSKSPTKRRNSHSKD